MTQLAMKPFMTVDDYLASEDGGTVRHEYIGGELYAMTGATDRHGLICGNIYAALRPLLRGTTCQLFANDMKVRLAIAGQDIFYYPDLLLACDPDDRATYYRCHPCLLVEVLSPTTARIDRREKLHAYQTIPTLREYLLIAQTHREVEIHRRTADGFSVETLFDGAVRLDCVDAELTFATVYEDVEVAPGPPPPRSAAVPPVWPDGGFA